MKKTVLAVVLLVAAFANTAVWAQQPLGDNDFEVKQNPDNTITIVKLKPVGGSSREPVYPVNVIIPEKIYNLPVTVIAANAFSRTGIQSVVIPNTVTTIGDSAFSGNKLTSVAIPDTVTTIGSAAFSGNPLISVTIGKGVKVIPANAFSASRDRDGNIDRSEPNPSLTEITIPDSVTVIGGDAFWGCGLTSVTLGSGLKTIYGGAFSNNKLTSVNIPDNVTDIGDSAFSNNGLTSVTLGSGLKTIGKEAFIGNKLTDVTLSAGLTSIGEAAFANNSISRVIGVRTSNRDNSSTPLTESVPTIQSVSISGNIESIGGHIFRIDFYIRSNRRISKLGNITRIALPAGIDDSALNKYGFEDNFISFYAGQGRVAGTYEKNGPIWARSRSGGVD